MRVSRAWLTSRGSAKAVGALAAAVVVAAALTEVALVDHPPTAASSAHGKPPAPSRHPVAGENYQICSQSARYLTSPWTYDALPSGSQIYTVARYQALPGYGRTLPPLPSVIADEGPNAQAAIIYAPGAVLTRPAYDYPETPLLYFFEGGRYGPIGLQSVSGDEFIGGSARGYAEPRFDDGGNAGGIDAQNDTYGYSGGGSTLASAASAGATSITTVTAIPGYIGEVTLSDGSTYSIASTSGATITLNDPLSSGEPAGSAVWADRVQPIAELSSPAPQGATVLRLTSPSVPLVPRGEIAVGANIYTVASASRSQTGYTATLTAGLDSAADAHTPVYNGSLAGDVAVEYLDIAHDQHSTTGTIHTGSGWTIEHNDIHDGYSSPGDGVAIDGGDESTIEYNCISKMGDYGMNLAGTNVVFDYNEVADTNYKQDPGCGCSGGGKWWGTLNADIVDNAFINDGPGGGGPVWLDNGNSGTLISGNYFYLSYSSAITDETGFNLHVVNNLFVNNGWGSGNGGGANNDGAVNINSTGGFDVPGSRYENDVLISDNQFINNWMGVDIWQAGARSCENSGESGPGPGTDAAYCSGGFPNSAAPRAHGKYYFSHIGDSSHTGSTTLAESAAAGSSTILVQGAEAIDDHVGFGDPIATRTTSRIDVSAFQGSGTLHVASTARFPVSGQLRVGTSAAWSDGSGSYTGAILAYAGKTATGFAGVKLLRGSGTLTGPILEIQPYTVTAETCYTNDCALTISPRLTTPVRADTEVSNAGTCQLYATSSALPSGPIAPDGVSYWDGCQWEARSIAVAANTFVFQPSVIAGSAPLTGARGTTTCSAAHTDSCGTNFVAYQDSGEAPFDTQIAANALMSRSSLKTCPSWDSGCRTDPLADLNALAKPPGSPAHNGEAPYDDVWTGNTYSGPWAWTATYLYGTCSPVPADQATGLGLSTSACGGLDLSHWQTNWQQDLRTADTALPAPDSRSG